MEKAALALGMLLTALLGGTATASAQETGPLFFGRVIADSADTPVRGASVGLPALGLVARTDSLGRFSFPARLPSRLVIVRVVALGYEPIDTSVELPEGDSAAVDFVVSRLSQVLEAVRINSRVINRRLRDFERRRVETSGQFFGDSAIGRLARAGRISTIIQQNTQLRIVGNPRGVGTEQYVIGARGSELAATGARPCYSAVMLDGSWVYSGQGGEPPFNINSIPAETILAMEIYRSTADIPVEFRRMGFYCGLVVIWLK